MMNGEISKSSSQQLSIENAKELVNSVDAFLFDCDGVIWKGDKLIDGVPQTLDMLRSLGKKLVFVTNNSTKSRRKYAEKFHSLGIPVNEDEIFSSSFAAAMYLKVNDFPIEKKVYVIGEEGILEELELAGFTALGGPADGKKNPGLKSNCLFEHDKSVQYTFPITNTGFFFHYCLLSTDNAISTFRLELLLLDLTNISTFISYSMELFASVRIPVASLLRPTVMHRDI